MARADFRAQLSFFQIPIDEVEIDPFSRDQLPKLMRGLQEIYRDSKCFSKIVSLIKNDLIELRVNRNPEYAVGASGATAWEVFVLLTLRQNGNYNYDQIADLASNHFILRAIMGIDVDSQVRFPKSTVHDNIKAIKPETLNSIAQEVLRVGHEILNPNNDKLELVADTFVFETNIHFHIDYVSILDGTKALLRIGKKFSKSLGLPGFRKSKHINKQVKLLTRNLARLTKSRKLNRQEEMERCLKSLLSYMNLVFEKAFVLLDSSLGCEDKISLKYRGEIEHFLSGTCYEADLAVRRIFEDEKIPPKEKIFSLFEAHTELICKGKAKAPQEFGHRVLVIQDQFGFIHACKRVESGYVDSEIIVEEIVKLKKVYPHIGSLSLDKGFWSPENKEALEALVETLILPNKGKRGAYVDQTDEYKRLRNKHSKVESCINALEQGNNLHICYDKGLKGFDQALARAVLARNIHEVGNHQAIKKRAELAKQKSA